MIDSDDEEIEEIDTKEDGDFLDDDCDFEEGSSFYRALDVKREQQESEQVPELRTDRKEKKKIKPRKIDRLS